MKQVALVGCGGWGQNHARTLHQLGVLSLVCDSSQSRLDQFSASYPGVRTVSDFSAVLADPNIHGVVLATPSTTHADLALAALRSGKDVLVEKPMALTVAEGQSLVDEAARCGQILMVGHVLEYHPAFLQLKKLIGDGALGKIFSIQSHRLNLGRIRTEENALWSFAPHDIALILRLLGEFPESVACHGGAHLNQKVADSTLTFMDFPSGAQAHIHVSWLHPYKEHRLVVVGSKQMAVFDDLLPWDSKLSLYPHKVDWVNGKVPVASRAESVKVPLEIDEPLKAECEEFLRCIETRRKPLTDGESGLRVIKVLSAAQTSLESKGTPQRNTEMTVAPRFFAHPTAVVDAKAQIGAETRIWHFSHVMAGAKLGERCVLGQNVHIARNAVIGNGVKIQNNVSVYEGVTLEDNVFCGPSMVFTNVINPRSQIERKNEFRKTLIKKGATLGANCTIVCGNEVGQFALIGAGSVVTKNIPDFALAVGSPARVVGWVCECGTKLAFEDEVAVCKACTKLFRKSAPHRVMEASIQ